MSDAIKRLRGLADDIDWYVFNNGGIPRDMRAIADEMEAENTKLRELCKRFAEYVSHDRCEGCVVKRRCNDGEVDECWQGTEIRKVARELGIEVE